MLGPTKRGENLTTVESLPRILEKDGWEGVLWFLHDTQQTNETLADLAKLAGCYQDKRNPHINQIIPEKYKELC